MSSVPMNISTKTSETSWSTPRECFYVRNAQNDIIGLIDKAGTQVVSYTYDLWGKLISIEGTLKDTVGVKNPYRYRGYRYDSETQLYYLQSRYYNPSWGRFINADGITGVHGELLSHNMFAYCANNPINMKDDSGYLHSQALDNFGGGGGGGAAVIPMGSALGDCLKGLWYGFTGTVVGIGKAIIPKSKDNIYNKAIPKVIPLTQSKDKMTTKLYRAMDYVEYNRLMKNGRFSSNAADKPWVMDTKWFATTATNASTWGSKLNPNGYKFVEVTVPTVALNGMYFNPFLDGIGPAYNSTVPYINSVKLGVRTVK